VVLADEVEELEDATAAIVAFALERDDDDDDET
jgi:hypothetical protein